MTYMALRASGVSPTRPSATVYATWGLLATAMQALYTGGSPKLLSDNATIYVQGGQTFGVDGSFTNTVLSPFVSEGNNKNVLIQTDPGELATPATILGRIAFNDVGANQNLEIKKLKLYGNFNSSGPYHGGSGGTFYTKIEDCFIAINNSDGSYVARCGSGWFKNCTIAVTAPSGNLTRIDFSPGGALLNCAVVVYSSSTVSLSNDTGNKNNTVFNYGAGSVSLAIPGNWTNTIVDNPNFVTAAITSPTEAAGSIIARNLHLTSGSSNCRDNADPATATATDIEGKARG